MENTPRLSSQNPVHFGRLTPAQEKMLAAVERDGERKYNGRARRTIQALKRAGYIEYTFDLIPRASGPYEEVYTVRLKRPA